VWTVSATPSHLTALCNCNRLHWLALWVGNRPRVLDLPDNVHALNNLSEDDVLVVQVWSAALGGDDEELGAIGVWACAVLGQHCH
jgi:hypothetical protein